MKNDHSKSGISLSQHLDAVEETLDGIAGTLSQTTDAYIRRMIDDTFSRLSAISRRVAEIKNSFAFINKLPTETVVHIATFFAKERDLVSATAVCRCWRVILLSSPQLWCNIGGSLSEIQAYIERSRSMPIFVSLSTPESAEFIAPHTSRLVSLAVQLDDTKFNLNQVAEHLRHPIPTLHTFRVSAGTLGLQRVALSSYILDPFFIHSRKLDLDGVFSFARRPKVPNPLVTFPHVTELTVQNDWHTFVDIDHFLETLEQLPMLEKVSITFAWWRWYGLTPTVTLPRVREMSVFAPKLDETVPPILMLIKLPNLTSLHLQIPLSESTSPYPILPTTSFDEYLPNLTNIPDLQATMDETSIEVAFRNPQAVFSYVAADGFRTYHRDRSIWGALPLHTVRRLIVDVRASSEEVDDGWFVNMLQDLPNLERVTFRGGFPAVVQRLRCEVVRGELSIPIRTLVECAAGEYETRDVQPLAQTWPQPTL